MPAPVILFGVLVAAYRVVQALWNACTVFLQVMRSMMQEAKQEAAEVMSLLDDGVPMMDAITSTSLLLDAAAPANLWQMLIIARASSFVLLLQLSNRRVLYLEVDESFIVAKLEVIRTELMLHIQHVPHLLQVPIGMHDTRLVRYTPMKLPYLWKEEQADPRHRGEVVERSTVPAAPASPVSAGAEGRSRRKKYVQLLKEGELRRRQLHMDRVGRVGMETGAKREMGIAKTHREKRKALANATNMGIAHDEGGTPDETHGLGSSVAETPKQVRMERNIHAALSENLSVPDIVQEASLRKAVENVQQRRRSGVQSLRRKRGQFDLYGQGVQGEFSLVQNMGQGTE